MNRRAEFDTGPLSWVKGEIDLALQRGLEALRAFAAGDAERIKVAQAQLHQAHGALQIVGLDGVTRLTEELEALLADLARGMAAPDAAASAERGFTGMKDYLDALIGGTPNQPLRLLALYRELCAARCTNGGGGEADPVDLYFPSLSFRPPWRDKAPVQLHSEEAAGYFREQRTRYQRGFVTWLKGDAAGARDMHGAVQAIEQTQGPTPQRAFWWVSSACLEAIAGNALPSDSANGIGVADLRRLCNRIEGQVRRLAEGTPNVSERLLREALYLLAQAQPLSEGIREVQEICALEASLPRPQSPGQGETVAAESPGLRPAREQLGRAMESWSRHAADAVGNADALEAYAEAAAELAAQADNLGNADLAALCRQISQVGVALRADARRMSEALALENATALLLTENALGSLGADGLALGEAFTEQSLFVCERLEAALEGRLLRTAPDIPLLDEMSRQAQERLVMEQVVVEMQANLRHIERVLDGYFRDPAQQSEALQGVVRPLHQLTGALEMLGEAHARDALAASEAVIARFAQPGYVPASADFEGVAQALSALGFHIAALARGEASDFDALFSPVPRTPAAAQSEAEVATVEQQLENQKDKAQELIAELKRKPTDTQLRDELRRELQAIHKDASLVADARLEHDTQEALAALDQEKAAPESSSLAQALQPLAPETPPPSAQAAKLADASDQATDAELVGIFLEEADEVLGTIAGSAAQLQANAGDHDALVTVRRGFHTLKGSGRMVGLNRLGEAAWTVEQALNWWLNEERPASSTVLALITGAHDYFQGAVAALQQGAQPADAALLAQLAEAVKTGKALPEQGPGPESRQAEVADIAAGAAAAAAQTTAAPHPEPDRASQPAEEDTVRLGEASITTTVFTIFSGEAHALMGSLRDEFQTLETHGIVTDEMLRSAHTLAGIAGTVRLQSLSTLGHAFERALEQFARDALGETEQALIGEAVEAIGGMVEEAIELRVAELSPNLVLRLEQAALPRVEDLPLPQVFQADPNAVLPEEEGALQRDEAEPVATPSAVLPETPPTATAQSEAQAPTVARAHQGRPGGDRLQDELDAQLLPLFLDEAAELTPAITSDLMAWKQAAPGAAFAAAGQALQRRLHTLKGSARMAGAMAVGEVSHHMETRVEGALAAGRVGEGFFDVLDGSFDRLALLLEGLHAPQAPPTEARAAEVAAAPEAEFAPQAATLRVRAEAVDRMVNQTGEVSIARSRIETELAGLKSAMQELTDNVARLRSQLREIEIQAESQLQAAHVDVAGVQHKEGFDPLEFDRFTRFQELTRLMAESVSDVQTVHQNLARAVEGTDAALAAQARLNRELQQDLMRVRMVAFNTLSERLHRVVRQTAKDAGKRANLDIRGAGVELDRAVLARITAPVEHVLRNAVTHGIEAPAQRAAQGKPELGDIRIELSQEGSEMRLLIADDGAGLDLQRIRAKAVQNGLLAEGANFPEAELADFIFRPGFSTAGELTQSAGRGVGMDVVRSEVAALGGRVELASQPGRGMRLTIYLPQTLAVMQAVLVRWHEQLLALPAAMVEQVMQYRAGQLAELHGAGQIEWRGRRYPLHYLGRLLGYGGAPEPRRLAPVMLLRSGASAIALQVDDIIGGSQEVVVKAIGPQLRRVPGVAGATVLGSGAIALIINPVPLATLGLAPTAVSTAPLPAVPEPAAPLVMVVDDSLTVRKITSRLLERAGYTVVTARDGVEALEKLREELPGVMLLDIEMPRMDGFELARHVRADAQLAGLPIIMISSRTADKHRNVARELGVEVFLGKPYRDDELLGHIAGFVGGSAAAK